MRMEGMEFDGKNGILWMKRWREWDSREKKWDFMDENMEGMGFNGKKLDIMEKKDGANGILWRKNRGNGI